MAAMNKNNQLLFLPTGNACEEGTESRLGKAMKEDGKLHLKQTLYSENVRLITLVSFAGMVQCSNTESSHAELVNV